MAAFFSENAVRITPAGIFRGREAIGRELQRVSVDLGLHDYSAKRTVSRLQGNMVFNAGEWQARLSDGKQYHGLLFSTADTRGRCSENLRRDNKRRSPLNSGWNEPKSCGFCRILVISCQSHSWLVLRG
jgi:hypothetical protein